LHASLYTPKFTFLLLIPTMSASNASCWLRMTKFTSFACWIALGVLIGGSSPANAETVSVKYRGEVDLAPFACEATARSSFIERICYDAKNSYMLINLRGTWYHYCEIDQGTVSDLLEAESMGRFYNASIKGNFDCRTHRVPAY
jgi:hypothetical protein